MQICATVPTMDTPGGLCRDGQYSPHVDEADQHEAPAFASAVEVLVCTVAAQNLRQQKNDGSILKNRLLLVFARLP